MTDIAYPDCWAVSPNGRLRLEARSPYNGTIGGRNRQSIGKRVFRLQYRVHQDEFRYQLIETARGWTTDVAAVIWERLPLAERTIISIFQINIDNFYQHYYLLHNFWQSESLER
jgi:hypothetical protein